MKVNAGQAPSTLIPEYIGSDFNKVITVADNMEAVTEVVDNLDHIKTIENNLGIINTVAADIEEVVAVGSNITDVKSVVANMDHIKTVESKLEDITTVADNIVDVVNVSDNMDYVKDVAQGIEGLPVVSYIGDEPPTQPLNGAEWFCTKDGRTYTWYEDGDSGQWVESSPQSVVGVSNTFALWKRSLAEAGYNLIGSFQDGCTVTSVDQVVLDTDASAVYQWKGTIPVEGKVIPSHSTPITTGGISSTAWVDRTDGALRNELSSDSGSGMLGFSHDVEYAPATVGYRLKNSVYADDAPYLADTTGVDDASDAINAALSAVPFGWTVMLKPGRYKLGSRITIPNFKRLLGTGWCLDPSNTALYGVVLSVEWGAGQNEHAVEVSHSSALEGVMFYYPNQAAKTASTPVEYGFSVSTPVADGAYDNIRLRNITLYNSYRGIRLNNAGRFDVGTVIGNPLKTGFTADNCLDVCYMDHVHFWNFYTQSAALEQWVSENGQAFDLRRIDQLFGSKLFGWNYYECFGFGDGLWGNFTDILCDKAFTPMRIEAVGHVQVNGFTLIGNAKARPAIWGRSGGSAKFSNGRITDTCSVGAQIDDGALYTFDNVQFDNPHSAVVNTSSTSDVRISDSCKWKTPPFGQYNTVVNGERLPGRSTEITLPTPWLSPSTISGGYSFDLSTSGTKQLAYETTYISQRNGLYVFQFDYELIGNPTTFYFQITVKNDVGTDVQVSLAPLYPMVLNGGAKTVFVPIFINHGRYRQSLYIDAVVTSPTVGASLKMTNIKLWEQGDQLTTNAQVSNMMRLGYNLDAFSMGQTLEAKSRNRRVYTNPEAGIGRATITPTHGAWNAGDEVVASTPVAGQPYRVRCSVSGTPGTWTTVETA